MQSVELWWFLREYTKETYCIRVQFCVCVWNSSSVWKSRLFISAQQTAFLLCWCCSLYLRSIKADVLSCPGGSSQRGHVHHHPCATALPADTTAAGAAGLRPAWGLCGDAEEAGAIPWHHRGPPADWLVLAESGGVHQWGAGAFPALCQRQVQVAFEPSRHHPEVPNHQSGSGESLYNSNKPDKGQQSWSLTSFYHFLQPVNGLPTAQTCFFLLRLPPYTSQAILSERLRYSIHNCTSIDMDNYMLTHNTEPADSSGTEDWSRQLWKTEFMEKWIYLPCTLCTIFFFFHQTYGSVQVKCFF